MFETLVRLRLTSVFYVREAIKKVVNFQCRVEVELNGGGACHKNIQMQLGFIPN